MRGDADLRLPNSSWHSGGERHRKGSGRLKRLTREDTGRPQARNGVRRDVIVSQGWGLVRGGRRRRKPRVFSRSPHRVPWFERPE